MSNDDEGRTLEKELESVKRRNQDLLRETETLRAKVICLESEKGEYIRELRKYKDALLAHKKELANFHEHKHAKKELENQVDNHKRQILELQADLDRLRDLLKETETDMRKYQSQYQDSMDLIEKLTANNVDLKIKVSAFSSELDSLQVSYAALQSDHATLLSRSERVSSDHDLLNTQLEAERSSRVSDAETLQRQLEERDAEMQRLRLDYENAQNEKRLLSRTYHATLKDLKRQLAAAAKAHCNGSENGKGDPENVEQISLKSRASSSSSLDASPVLLHCVTNHNTFSHSEDSAAPSPQASADIDKALLIEKIVNLQRELARKDEKCDFLEDHIALLTAELKKAKLHR
ncbi:coiled-coil domain-containing protein 186-like [Paramacrobiotus metropolitanus]|uniref:coiled-coil domain-containing protein 186-like n=1 Tax=Paramacrobiotus metropolitanus TaxID=2943436 RepID=UPI002445DB48|nr:coiled-coil domain-containing protein 186-like [Paramacrobiotus metropolitanus]